MQSPRTCSSYLFVAILTVMATISTFGAEFRWNWRTSRRLDSKHTLRTAYLQETERAALATAIIHQLLEDRIPYDSSDEDLMTTALDIPISFADLNNDGIREVIAQGIGEKSGCSPTGNCPLWVFQETPQGYKLLLDTTCQSFYIERHRTNGYRDIVAALHSSASSSRVDVHQYEEGGYNGIACYSADWQSPTGETRKKPLLTRCR